MIRQFVAISLPLKAIHVTWLENRLPWYNLKRHKKSKQKKNNKRFVAFFLIIATYSDIAYHSVFSSLDIQRCAKYIFLRKKTK